MVCLKVDTQINNNFLLLVKCIPQYLNSLTHRHTSVHGTVVKPVYMGHHYTDRDFSVSGGHLTKDYSRLVYRGHFCKYLIFYYSH